MSKQLKLDVFWKEKKIAPTSSLTTKMMKKRKFEGTKTVKPSIKQRNVNSTFKIGEDSYPFWWNKDNTTILEIKNISPLESLSGIVNVIAVGIQTGVSRNSCPAIGLQGRNSV